VGQLPDFVEAFNRSCSPQVTAPIGSTKAVAHIHNPAADSGDPALLVAWYGDLCVGYWSLVPGWLKTPRVRAKIFWLSSLFVVPEYRKYFVMLKLMQQLASLGVDLVATNFTAAMWDIYRGLKFRELPSLALAQLGFFRFDPFSYVPYRIATRLEKTGAWRKAKRISDAVCVQPLRQLYYALSRSRELPNGLSVVPVGRIRTYPDGAQILPPRCATYFERDLDIVNWMLTYPWSAPPGDSGSVAPDFFAKSGRRPVYSAYEIRSGSGDYRGFFVLSMSASASGSNGVVKVLDTAVVSEVDLAAVAVSAWELARRVRALRVVMPAWLAPLMHALPLSRLLMYRDERHYMYRPSSHNSPLAAAADQLTLDLNDCDFSFW
jgi:hypothetical protein